MRIYLVIIGDNIFEYSYFGDSTSLLDLNKRIKEFKSYTYPLLSSSDTGLFKSSGGTVMYRHDDKFVYLVNLDHNRDPNAYNILDDYLLNKFESFRVSIKRDIKLNQII